MTFSVLEGLKKFKIEHKFVVKNIYEYYARWIREGRLRVNADWNRDLKIKFTVQDPCQIVRKSYGDPIAEDLRFVVKTAVGEENFIDMQPNRSNNYCCGGGGGLSPVGVQGPAAGVRTAQGRTDPGDRRAVLHRRLPQLPRPDPRVERTLWGGYHVVHLWTILCLALGILGPNERAYLGDDLRDVAVLPGERQVSRAGGQPEASEPGKAPGPAVRGTPTSGSGPE